MSNHSSDSLHDPEIRNQRRENVSLPLFEQAHARRSDPATSKAAAASVTNTEKVREGIKRILGLYGQLTDEQLAEHYLRGPLRMNWPKSTPSGLRTRRSELVESGDVCDSGHTGRTAAGRACTIWRLCK